MSTIEWPPLMTGRAMMAEYSPVRMRRAWERWAQEEQGWIADACVSDHLVRLWLAAMPILREQGSVPE